MMSLLHPQRVAMFCIPTWSFRKWFSTLVIQTCFWKKFSMSPNTTWLVLKRRESNNCVKEILRSSEHQEGCFSQCLCALYEFGELPESMQTYWRGRGASLSWPLRISAFRPAGTPLRLGRWCRPSSGPWWRSTHQCWGTWPRSPANIKKSPSIDY